MHEARDLAIAAILGVPVRHVDAARHKKKTTYRFDRRFVRAVGFSPANILLATSEKKFRVGADRYVRPRVAMHLGFIVVVLLFVDVYYALAGWMHRVCADLAGCYENPVLHSVRLGWSFA